MITRGMIAFITITIASFLFITACDVVSEKGIEESMDVISELTPIQGAENVTMTVNRGDRENSYFTLEFSNIESNSIINNGIFGGWCIVYDKPIDSNGGIYDGLKLFDTFGAKSFKPLNHLINERYALRDKYPDMTWKELQVLVWSVMDNLNPFDLESVDTSLLSRLHQNGQPLYNKEMIREILSQLKESVKDWKYEWWQDSAVVVDNGVDDQTVITFRTQTPGGWGAPAAGNNAGVYRDANFASAFPAPDHLIVGSTFTLQLTSAAAVQAFLPSGGPSNALSTDHVDPTSNLGAFTGHVVALTLTTRFDDTDPDFSEATVKLKDMIINKGMFEGWTVQEVLDEANVVLGGASSSYTINDLHTIVAAINENYVDGKEEKIVDPDLLRLP